MIKCKGTWKFQKVSYFYNVFSFRRVSTLDVDVMFTAKLSMSNRKRVFYLGTKKLKMTLEKR